MKRIYCDICGNPISDMNRSYRLILPVWNRKIPGTVMEEFTDVCGPCTDSIGVYIKTLVDAVPKPDAMEPGDHPAVEWHPISVSPESDGRYLVADSRMSGKGRPHVSIAMYSREDDEWATNALIHPEDIICWTFIPETPERFFKEKEDLIEEGSEQ